MAEIPAQGLYSAEHEYLLPTDEDGVYNVGITDYAQGELGDIVYVELPQAGASFEKMQVFGTVEAVKAVSDLYCPIAGEVVAVNDALSGDPSLVNRDPYGEGWMIRLRVSAADELKQLMSAEAYRKHVGA